MSARFSPGAIANRFEERLQPVFGAGLAAPRWLRQIPAIGLVGVGIAVATLSSYQVIVLGTGLLVGLGGVGAGLLIRSLRLVTLDQGAFIGLGAYVELILGNRHWTFVPSLLAGLAVGLVAGLFIGLAASRLRTHYFILLTAAVQATATACILGLGGLTGGTEGMAVHPTIDIFGFKVLGLRSIAELIVVVSVVGGVFAEFVYNGRRGREMLAAGTAVAMARAAGTSPTWSSILGNCIAGSFGVVAGALYAPFIGYLGPEDFSISLSIMCLLVGILCLRTSFWVTILGGVALQELTQGISSNGATSGLIYGLVIVGAGIAMAIQSKRHAQ